MKPIYIAQIGIRLVAIYLIAQGISAISSAYLAISSFNQFADSSYNIFISTLLAFLSPGVIGFLLWFLAPRLSTYFLPDSATNDSTTSIDFGQFQAIIITLVGVYIIANNIPISVSVTFLLLSKTVEINGTETYDLQLLSSAIAVYLKVILGIALVVGSNWINSKISKLRTVGTN